MYDTLEAGQQASASSGPTRGDAMFVQPIPCRYIAMLTLYLAMDISGEAVEAEFEQRLRSILSPRDYKGDLDWLIYHVCREFKEEKKNCGQPPRPGSSTWNIPAPRLRKNSQKGFEKDCLKLDRYVIFFIRKLISTNKCLSGNCSMNVSTLSSIHWSLRSKKL